MATWISSDDRPDDYWQVTAVVETTVGLRHADDGTDLGWWIIVRIAGDSTWTYLKGPFPGGRAEAASALAGGIAELGGAI
jgi:hypothetical protein